MVAALAAAAGLGAVEFVTNGAAFSPLVQVDAGASVSWRWSDGTTSNSASPTVSWGSSAARTHRLRVRPWSALRSIVLGYDGSDGGAAWDARPGEVALPSHPAQPVIAVRGLGLARGLQRFAASNTPLAGADFGDCAQLTRIECYHASLEWVVAPPNARRLCLEENALSGVLDLTQCNELVDVRAAVMALTEIRAPMSLPDCEHFCSRDSLYLTSIPDPSTFGALRELYVWGCPALEWGVVSSLAPSVHEVICYDAHMSSAVVDSLLLALPAIGDIMRLHGNSPHSSDPAVLAAIAAKQPGWPEWSL